MEIGNQANVVDVTLTYAVSATAGTNTIIFNMINKSLITYFLRLQIIVVRGVVKHL